MSEKDTEKKSGKGKKIIFILLAIVLAGGCAFGGYYFATKKSPSPNQMAVNTQGMQNAVLIEETTFELGEFTVKLSDEDEKRYAKVKIYVGFPKENKKLAKEIEERKSILRDAVNLELMAKKSKDLDAKGAEKLKKDLTTKINTGLTKGQILNVYFDNIIVQ